MTLINSENYNDAENAEEQFDEFLSNCEYILWYRRKPPFKKRINFPQALREYFDKSLSEIKENQNLEDVCLLQQALISSVSLMEEWYNFRSLDALYNSIPSRSILEHIIRDVNNHWEKEKIRWDSLFLDAAKSLETNWAEPPYKEIITARNHFSNLAQEKLDADQAALGTKLKDTHLKIPWFFKAWPYGSVYLEKENFRTDIDKKYRVEEGEIQWIKVKKWYAHIGWDLSVIEILEWPYAWEQLFSDQWMSNGFKRDIVDENRELYSLPNNGKEYAQDIELFRSTLHDSVDTYPGYIQLDKNWELKIHQQWKISKYWWNLGCSYSLVSQKWQSDILVEDSEEWVDFRAFHRSTFHSVRAIYRTPSRNKYSYE